MTGRRKAAGLFDRSADELKFVRVERAGAVGAGGNLCEAKQGK